MKRTYITPTAAMATLGEDLMRVKMVNWSLGRVQRVDKSELWYSQETHPVEEAQDWLKRPNTSTDAWSSDIWGESE